MADIVALLAGLDAGERVRGRGFERLCKWVLENEPEYASRLERVWLWDEWPGRWAADAGIDLVAEDRDGGLWAVQAKHYDAAYAIRKADLDSFLSESSRPEFTYRLLIASTDHLGATARRTLDAQEKPVGTLLRADLAALDLPWPRSLARLRPAKLARKRPRPHQRRAVKDVVVGLAEHDRGQLVMACGTGKTLAARFLHDELASKRTLVLVPSLSLVKQTIREWFTVGEFDYLAVCSDDTVAHGDRDAVVASTSELGVPVTTDPVEIAAFLRKRGSRPRVVFATYQSSQRIADAQAGTTPLFDLVVADEAHRCAGPEAGVFATVLDAVKIKARKRLFMTATPRYYTGRLRKEASEADWEIASMDDEQKFGPVLHRLTFAEAIEQNLLCDYQVVVVGVSDSSYRDMAERAAFVTADGETVTDARTLASQLGLLRAMKNHNLHRVVSFHSRIRSAREFATSLPDVSEWMPSRRRPSGKLWTQHVSGEMTSGEREARLYQLREVGAGERGVLTNARCLTEGVDVPTLDGVAFIEPRRSQVDIVQAVGRAMRKADDKTVGTIVIPVFVDENADPEQALDSSEFDRVWQVVKALRAHDEVLAEELDELRRERGRTKRSGGGPEKIKLDVPVGVGVAFARAFDTRVVERSTSGWEEGVGAARTYREAHGHLRVPASFVAEDGFSLGKWISRGRTDYRQGRLLAERVAALDALGMVWDAFEEDWGAGIAAARAYRQATGHLLVPQKHVTRDGFRLGQWISDRREHFSQSKLSPERVAALDALGMVWDAIEEDWRRGIAAARVYRGVHADLRVPSRTVTEQGFRLGPWIRERRTERRQGRLSPERVAALDALGMVWDAFEEDWQRGIAAARAYGEEHGDVRVMNKFVTDDGFPLGQWISNRRAHHTQRRLSRERVAALDALGMVWDAIEEDWRRGITAARSYQEACGHLRAPTRFVTDDGFRLGQWISDRRKNFSQSKLSPERVAALDALGMVWDAIEDDWQRGIAAARFYRIEHGDLRIPATYVTDGGFRLGGWISNRRRDRKLGRLSPTQIDTLDLLGMVWDPLEEVWQRGIVLARRHRDEQGDLRISQSYVTDDGFTLGAWVSRQRRERASGALSSERIDALDALGMIWDVREDGWQFGLATARAYREEHGDLRVPQRFVTEDGFRFGNWIVERRTQWKQGKLSSARIAALDALGMVWDAIEEDWQRGIVAATAYREEHGDLRVPQRFATDNGFPLGRWVSVRRDDRRKGSLSQGRIAALDALGMIWDALEAEWKRGIDAASTYREEHGDLRVSSTFVNADGFALGSWISHRRAFRRQGTLSPERTAALDALGMIWHPFSDGWQRGIDAARVYREDYGDLRVPRRFVAEDGFRLGQWIQGRREEHRRAVLSPERVALLDALGMVWDQIRDDFERGLAAARAYRDAYGDLTVPARFVADNGFPIGHWISNRRTERKQERLSPERVADLDALGMVWDAKKKT